MLRILFISVTCMFVFSRQSQAQDVKANNARSWSLSGLIQLQHLWNNEIENDAAKINNGFHIRRGRLQAKAKMTDRVSTKFQIEVRDNSPKLKDAEAKIKFFDDFFIRGGQFKVPVWREELRSSGKLFLVERSEVAEFLADNYLSARHIGIEVGGKLESGVGFAVNYSNGAGEGGREDAGRLKSESINNGKLFTARLNTPLGENIEFGLSGALNQLGTKQTVFDTVVNKDVLLDKTGSVFAVAPDFGIYLSNGFNAEGGFVYGKFGKTLAGKSDDVTFMLADVNGCFKKKLNHINENLGGMDTWELAGGVSLIDPDTEVDDNEVMVFRFGPAFYFGSKTRLQFNAEIEKPTASGTDTIFKVRSQLIINM